MMNRVALSSEWDRWRRKRRAEFRRAGARPDLADDLSRLEAEVRQRIEAFTSRRTALAAQLTLVPGQDGGETIGFVVDPNLIDPMDRARAYRALGVHAITLPTSILCGKAMK